MIKFWRKKIHYRLQLWHTMTTGPHANRRISQYLRSLMSILITKLFNCVYLFCIFNTVWVVWLKCVDGDCYIYLLMNVCVLNIQKSISSEIPTLGFTIKYNTAVHTKLSVHTIYFVQVHIQKVTNSVSFQFSYIFFRYSKIIIDNVFF